MDGSCGEPGEIHHREAVDEESGLLLRLPGEHDHDQPERCHDCPLDGHSPIGLGQKEIEQEVGHEGETPIEVLRIP